MANNAKSQQIVECLQDVQGLELLVAAALGSFVVGAGPAVSDQEHYGDAGVSLFYCIVEYTIISD